MLATIAQFGYLQLLFVGFFIPLDFVLCSVNSEYGTSLLFNREAVHSCMDGCCLLTAYLMVWL